MRFADDLLHDPASSTLRARRFTLAGLQLRRPYWSSLQVPRWIARLHYPSVNRFPAMHLPAMRALRGGPRRLAGCCLMPRVRKIELQEHEHVSQWGESGVSLRASAGAKRVGSDHRRRGDGAG
jgi:hypothetical protein